eukprot:185657_1
MSAPTKDVSKWDLDDFMQFVESVGIKKGTTNYNKIKTTMEENSLSVSDDVKGSAVSLASLFGIHKVIATKIQKPLYKLRLSEGINETINTPEHKQNNQKLNNSVNNNEKYCINFRGKQGKALTLRTLFTANDTIGSVAEAYKAEECVNQSYKVEKIILQSGGQVLNHDKKLSYYNITNENNLITIIFKTKGGAMPSSNEDRQIRFQKYGLQKSHLPDCLIGYDDDDEIDRALLDCGKHAMAADTMFSYVTTTLASNARQKDIFCPIKGCGKKLSWRKCTQIADMNRNEYLKWTDILEKHRVADMKQCPHCQTYCKRDDGVAIFRMSASHCNSSDWCWNCCQSWKGSGLSMCGNQNCSIIKETNEKLQNCEVVKPQGYQYELPRFRACPRCLTFIEYTTACKHMICSGCDKQFCFVCLGLQGSDGQWGCGNSGTVCKMAPKQKF